MVVSITSTPVSDILVSRNFVDSAYRKGIAVYSAAPGKVASITISSNTVLNCGLGGIYLANAPLASAQKNIIVSDNDLLRNYVAVQVSNVEGGTVMGNRAEGGSGQGIYLSDVVGVAVTGNSVVGVGSDGILVTSSVITSTGITVAANSVINPNQAGSASGAGIHLNTVTQSRVDANTVVGESSAPKQIYGILEDGAAKNNVFTANQVANAAVQLTQTIDPVTP
jgi:nitrous oxidase accessory protein NosD